MIYCLLLSKESDDKSLVVSFIIWSTKSLFVSFLIEERIESMRSVLFCKEIKDFLIMLDAAFDLFSKIFLRTPNPTFLFELKTCPIMSISWLSKTPSLTPETTQSILDWFPFVKFIKLVIISLEALELNLPIEFEISFLEASLSKSKTSFINFEVSLTLLSKLLIKSVISDIKVEFWIFFFIFFYKVNKSFC